ncbi:hypothetical protein [Actinoplanes xinjiangensis]|uniref:hypothetical protein n=1 Tax=Actinoplanes xinjiangensis TaxID=512350 RepID=UPI0034185576
MLEAHLGRKQCAEGWMFCLIKRTAWHPCRLWSHAPSTIGDMRLRSLFPTVLAGGSLILAMAGAFLVFNSATDIFDKVGSEDAAYVALEANIRPCPATDCGVSEVYRQGQQAIVTRTVKGEKVNGNDTWYEIKYGDDKRFVHSRVMTSASAEILQKVEPFLSLVTMFTIIPLAWLPGWQARAAAKSPIRMDRLLFAIVAAIGIGIGTLGYIFSRLSGGSPASFLGDTFVNLGAGFAGAAVTFVLFQSLLAKRSLGPDDLQALTDNVDQLRRETSDEIQRLRDEVRVAARASTSNGRPADEGLLKMFLKKIF